MRIAASVSPGEVRTALLDGDVMMEAWVDRPGRPDGVGDLQRARVVAVAPAMSGAFVELAEGETGFLPETELAGGGGRVPIARALPEGTVLAVRVIRAAQAGKGPRLSARLSEQEAAVVAAAGPEHPRRLARGPEAALRLARAHPHAPVTTDGAGLAARLRGELGAARVMLAARAFDDALEGEFDALVQPEAPLPGGGRLLIHTTPALTAIDIDAGGHAGARDAHAGTRLNVAAVVEAARQIRLRNLAGPILIDPAGLARATRESLVPTLTAALAGDRLARVLGMGPLGLLELVRGRVHPPLAEVLGAPSALTWGLLALRRAAREAAATPGVRLRLRAAPAVIEALTALPGALDAAAAAIGTPLALLPDPALAVGAELVDG